LKAASACSTRRPVRPMAFLRRLVRVDIRYHGLPGRLS
jgi:hypothetical protein